MILYVILIIKGLRSIRTGASTLHNFETVSGLRFAMFASNDVKHVVRPSSSEHRSGIEVTNIHEALQHIYSNLWVDLVVGSPLYRPGQIISPEEIEEMEKSRHNTMSSLGSSDEDTLENYNGVEDDIGDGNNNAENNIELSNTVMNNTAHGKFDIRWTNFETKLDEYLMSLNLIGKGK